MSSTLTVYYILQLDAVEGVYILWLTIHYMVMFFQQYNYDCITNIAMKLVAWFVVLLAH